MTEHSASRRSSAVHRPARRCPLPGDPRPRTTSRPGREERATLRQRACVGWAPGTRSLLSRRCHLACCGTAPSLPGQAGPGNSNTPCLANKPGCARPPGAQLTAGYQRQDVGARLSGRAEVARCSPPELLSAGLKLQDLWGRGSQCHSQWQAL